MLSLTRVFAPVVVTIALQSAPSNAASLSTSADVTIPSVIALYCYDKVRITREQIDVTYSTAAPDLAQTATGSPGNWDVSTSGPGTGQYNRINQTGILYVFDPTRLTMKGVCSFRALAGTSGVQVSITQLNNVLEGPGGASITMRDMEIRDAASTGTYSTSYSVDTTAAGLSETHGVDVAMDMDFSSTLFYGTYSSVADGTFSITVVANP